MILFCIGYTMAVEYERPNGPYDHEDYQKTTDEIIEAWVNSE